MRTPIERLGTHLPWSQVRPVLLPLLAGLAMLAAWEYAVIRMKLSPIILPAPESIIAALTRNLPLLSEHMLQTMMEATMGLALSSALGIALASALCLFPLFRRAVYPNLIFFQLIPKVALAPLFIIWIGVGIETRMAFAAFLAFFPIVVSSTAGLLGTDPNLLRLCRSVSASEWKTFCAIRFPAALPHIFSGLKIGATMTMIGLIVGEFVTAQSGLGYLTMFAAANLETPLMLATILLICMIGAALYLLMMLLELLTRRLYDF